MRSEWSHVLHGKYSVISIFLVAQPNGVTGKFFKLLSHDYTQKQRGSDEERKSGRERGLRERGRGEREREREQLQHLLESWR